MSNRGKPEDGSVAEGDDDSMAVEWTQYAAPAGLEEYGVQEGDRLSLNSAAEGLYCTFEVPIHLLAKLGAPLCIIQGVARLPSVVKSLVILALPFGA